MLWPGVYSSVTYAFTTSFQKKTVVVIIRPRIGFGSRSFNQTTKKHKSMIHSEKQKMSFNRLHQEKNVDDETIEPFSISTSRKWKKMLLSVSFWRKISLIVCTMAVSVDPLFFYIPFLDHGEFCLGMEKRLRNIVIIFRSLTDLSFIVHIIYEIRKAMELSKPMEIGGRLKILDWFEHAKPVAKNLSWKSFLTDIFAVLPIPQVLVLVLFYSPHYGFSENKMTLNYMLLGQYIPRMYWIFLSFKKIRKNSSIWIKVTFYFFMYMLASHVIGAFWYFNSIQVETICWFTRLKELHDIGETGYFLCDDPHPLVLESKSWIAAQCPVYPLNASVYDFGSFGETLSNGYTDKLKFRQKLFYFMWWGLKNLSNYGTNIESSIFIWENCFAILVSCIGLLLFALLIGNMQECFKSAEEMKVITDKVQLKGKELQVWMREYGLPEKFSHTEKLKMNIEIMTNIKKRMRENKDADLENLFSLIPWNSMKSLKRALCMNMLKEVPMLKYMDENGLGLISDCLKPVTYNEKTIVFRMGEPLDSMLLVLEGIMVIYTTSTTTDRSTLEEITGTPSTVHGSLENGSVYGHVLLSWASPDTPVTYATLPISTGNVKCLSQVEGFVLSAKDLKTLVSEYKLQWNYRNSDHVESGGGEGGTFYIERSVD